MSNITSATQGLPLFGSQRTITSSAVKYSFPDALLGAADINAQPTSRPALFDQVYGDEFKGKAPIDIQRFRELAQVANTQLTNALLQELARRGVGPQEEFAFSLDTSSRAIAVEGTDDAKRAFEQAFLADPMLKADIEAISRANDTVARATLNQRYLADWHVAAADNTQDAVASHYRALFSELDRKLQTVEFHDGKISTPAGDFVEQLS